MKQMVDDLPMKPMVDDLHVPMKQIVDVTMLNFQAHPDKENGRSCKKFSRKY